ncbi:MAG: alkaline phosphatase family protein [Anaerolineae bacterium]|nr:alkaline phosphatase family protein [Anaerolineae bacterium]
MTSDKRHVMAEAVRAAYRAGEDDETMEPRVLVDADGQPIGRIQDGDYVIFYDLRGEREVELTQCFTEPEFDKFPRQDMRVHFVTMIEYDKALDVRVAFPPIGRIPDTLCETVSAHGLRQVKIAESEKSIHVTFFLNGKRKTPFKGEKRVVIPSPHVMDYTQVPEMSAAAVAQATMQALRDEGNDFIVTNFANVDVVGHSENAKAIKRAVATVDHHIGQVVEAARQAGVAVLIVADHGTVEKWLYPDGAIDTGHTDSPVPCLLIAPDLPGVTLRDGGALTDVAPTVLHLLGLPQPEAMTGVSLLAGDVPRRRRRVLLLIADGWGQRDELYGNLIAAADTPVMDSLQTRYPATRLAASGEAVGMPAGTVGNSEVGHLHIGAGRCIYSDRVRVNRAIEDGSFFENEAFLWAVRGARRDGRRLHLLGIISFYSSHGSVEHLKALLRLARREGVPEVYAHGLLGRRGERPESGALYVEEIEREMQRLDVGRFVSVIGRFWALDREEHWERIEKSYRWLVYGEGHPVAASAE